ncbi:hypothetical protein ACWEPC_36295, partial [Nonomuraea sp. NPDC004297]
MSEIARRPVELATLSPELSPEVLAWVGELRSQFTALSMSISLFSRLHPIDKGTVSRYLNGKRVPADRWFLNQILALRASAGSPVTDEVREYLVELQMAALKIAHPHEYRVRKVSDELELAVTSWKEAERYAHNLEEQLVERTRTFQDVLAENERLRAGWDLDRTRYHQETIHLTQELELARDRVRRAEHRVQSLEEVLDGLETKQPSSGEFVTDFTSYDTRAVAGLLDSLRRAGADGQIATLVERVPDLPLYLEDAYDIAALLDALRRVGAYEQIETLVGRMPNLHANNPHAVIKLLDVFRRVGAYEQIAVLVERVSDLFLDSSDVYAVVGLLDALRRVGANEEIAVLAERVPELEIAAWYSVCKLLDALRRVGADKQIAELLERIPKFTFALDSANEVAELLEALHRVGAREQIAILAKRITSV